MIRIIDLPTRLHNDGTAIVNVDVYPNILAIVVDGDIQSEDLERVYAELEHRVDNYGDVWIYEEILGIGKVEWKAVIDKFKYLMHHGLKGIRGVVLVTDKNWIRTVANLEDKIFSGIDIVAYDISEKDQAVDYLCVQAENGLATSRVGAS